MFGNSSWTNPQNQPQQQQGTSAFGQQQQPNAFGSGGTTGFGGFGQNQQQQQQQQPQHQQPVNSMFGGTAGPGTAGTSGFGSFGSGTSAFGAPKPAGFGAFGSGTTGTTAFGSGGTGAFGQNTGASSAFGQPAAGTSTFGSGGTGLFGQKPAAPTSAFGSTSSTGAAAGVGDGAVAPVTTGSANPPFQPFSEKDTAAAGQPTLNYQSISCMPAYRGTSFEELRVQDYLQGRRTAGGFGQSATFGLQPSQSTSTAFGQPATGTTGFGGFGQTNQQNQPTSAFGSFGQPSTSQPSAFGTGTGTSTFGAFGQNAQQQQQHQPAGTGLFGGTSAFGQNNQQQQQHQPGTGTGTSTFGAFGQNANQPKPFGAFGQPSGTNTFGSGTAFGQTNTQPAGQTSTGLFGQPANQNQGTGTSVFGSFGQNKPAFGQPASQPASTGFGLFGQNQQNQQQQPNQQQGQQPSTGLFGASSTGTNLFGQQNQQQQQSQPGQQTTTQPSTGLFGQPASQPSTNLFGGGGTGTNLFGNNNNQNRPAFGTGLFGNAQTATTGTSQPSTGLFGQPLGQTNQQSSTGTGAFGTSLFGQKPASTNTFGQSIAQPASTGFGNSQFGTSALGGTGGGLGQSTAGPGGAQGAGMLTASVAQPVQENLPIFSLLNTSQPTFLAPPPKKTSNLFVDVPTRSPLGMSASRLSNAGKLRGFGVSQSSAGLNRNGGLSAALAYSRNGSNNRIDNKSLLGPEAFRSNPALGKEPISSPKKLVLNKKIDPSEVFGRSMAKGPATNGTKVEFNPSMSMAAREKEAAAKPAQPAVVTPAPPQQKKSSTVEKNISDLQDGDYYVKPPLEVLRKLSNRELSSFEGLVVGRKGYGEIRFLEPVDLTALPRLKDLLGKMVEIDKQECCVYPDALVPDSEKPAQGEGLNVRARIVLNACWPTDKATGEPIKDEKHPALIKHKKKLQNMNRTHFENFDNGTGNWTFTVDHF